jgi:hypothetical protein
MTAGNRDRARKLGFSEAAITWGPNEVLRNITYREGIGQIYENKVEPEARKAIEVVNAKYKGNSAGTKSSSGGSNDRPTRKQIIEAAKKRGFTPAQIKEALAEAGY